MSLLKVLRSMEKNFHTVTHFLSRDFIEPKEKEGRYEAVLS